MCGRGTGRPNAHCETRRWDSLVQQFRRNIFALHSLSGQSILDVTLQAGLSVLKNYGCGEVGLVQGREIPRFLRLVLSLTHTRCAGLGAQLGLPRLCRSHDDARHRSPFLKPHKLSARVLDVWRAHERGQPSYGSTQRQRVRDAFPAPRTPCFHQSHVGCAAGTAATPLRPWPRSETA